MSEQVWIAGDYEYTVRSRTEQVVLETHHPDEESLLQQGFRRAWADHTIEGAFFVYRRRRPTGCPRCRPGLLAGQTCADCGRTSHVAKGRR